VFGESVSSGAVLVTGSVITAGEARTMLKGRS
jgi:folylpolyglutamate synthase/dihydropteroate synthase